jgi:hypothetical protein
MIRLDATEDECADHPVCAVRLFRLVADVERQNGGSRSPSMAVA